MSDRLDTLAKKVAGIVLVCSSLFALYTSGFGLLSALTQRSLHWLFMSVAIFLLIPFRGRGKGKTSWVDILFAIFTLVTSLFLILTWEKNAMRIMDPSMIENIMGVLMIIVVLEATRRAMGSAMSVIAVISLLYAYFGPYFPGVLRHKGFGFVDLISFLYSTTEGVMGLALGVSATYIIVFVLFGSFLAKSGAGQLFIDLSLGLTGRARSGPALTTIISNALMGIISGSPVANVVTTGSFTLPLLKKTNYPDIKAASLLAVAATGSMFTPPVMGAGAFMIADYLSINYGKVVLAAIIPAALFYVSLLLYADIGARRAGLEGLSRDMLPDWRKALAQRGHLLIPIVLLIVFIVIGWSAIKTAFWCTILMMVLSWVKKESRMDLKKIFESLVSGSKDNISVAAACAAAGIIVGVISATGLGVKFSSILINLSANSPILALLLSMFAALIMGMGLPPTAVYIVLAALTIPSLIMMGIHPIAAHFFIFYFACIGGITPPVALTAYASAAIARTDPFKTGWNSFRMGLVAYIVPFIFVYSPTLLMQDSNLLEIIWAFVTAAIGVAFLTFSVEGYFNRDISFLVRILFFAGAIVMIIPGLYTDILGFVLIASGMLINRHSGFSRAISNI